MVDLIKRFKWPLFAIILLGGLVAWFDGWRGRREHSQDGVILAAAARHDVPPALIKAVVWRESWFNPNATGKSGEAGLMQIMDDTAHDWLSAEKIRIFRQSQLYDPARNTECGAWYLHRLLKRYAHTDDPVIYALAAYNAGPGNVTKWSTGAAATNSAVFLRQIGFPSTCDYVIAVTKRYQQYQRTFPPKDWKPKPPVQTTGQRASLEKQL